MNNMIDKYNQLNNSYKKSLVFHLGESAGFFSEYNCMLFAMLYCLQHKIRFVLYSKDANFGYKNGWTDYFEPFCDSTTSFIHSWLNVREFYNDRKITNLKTALLKIRSSVLTICSQIHKRFRRNTLHTQDLWKEFFAPEMLNTEYDIPELSIKGDLIHACSRLVELTWNYNSNTKNEIKHRIEKLYLPPAYISCQIRRGDKYKEYKLLNIHEYIDKLKEYSDYKTVFVFTDDYGIIEKLQKDCPQWNWLTTCTLSEKGYFHSSFRKKSKQAKKEDILKLLASIEIINQSDVFFGTRTTNPGTFMSIYNPSIAKFIDADDNKIITDYF
jgi:hypothetical protein